MVITGEAKEQGRGLPQEEPRLKLDELVTFWRMGGPLDHCPGWSEPLSVQLAASDRNLDDKFNSASSVATKGALER